MVASLFQGRWPNILTLDQKARLALPMRLRAGRMDDEGNTEFMIGQLQDPCLYLHSEEQHRSFLGRVWPHLGDTKEGRRAKTWILSRFFPVKADVQGRFTIPANLIQDAAIEREVCLIAQESRIEVWAAEKLRQLETEIDAERIGDVLEKVFAEEREENRTLRRARSPVGEGPADG